MPPSGAVSEQRFVLPAGLFQQIFDNLRWLGYEVIAPTVVDDAIVYERVESVNDLPIGLTDEQRAGTYRIKRATGKAFLHYGVGPRSWKHYLYPPHQRLWQARRNGDGGFEILPESEEVLRYAFVGVRPCEPSAI